MFKRRVPLTFLQRMRQAVWPSIGWRRAGRYTYLRVMRSNDGTHKIAGGLAIGTAVAFTPILGTHFIQAALLAWIFRCNIVAAIAATWLANPWTIPLIWWGSIELGAWIFGFFGVNAQDPLPMHMSFKVFWDLLVNDPVQVLLPWLTGGYLLALVVCLPAYGLFYYLVRGARSEELRLHEKEVHPLVSAE